MTARVNVLVSYLTLVTIQRTVASIASWACVLRWLSETAVDERKKFDFGETDHEVSCVRVIFASEHLQT